MNIAALHVGAAREILTPPPGFRMAGYAARACGSTGTSDELYCRVAVFDDGATTLVLAVCDLLYATVALTRLVREQVSAALSVPEHHVMLCATHTHCGPGDLAVPTGAELRATLADCVVAAAVDAARAAQPARLVTGKHRVAGINADRRSAAGPTDDAATVVAAYPLAPDREPIVTLVNFACHPTVLGPDVSQYSADFPGAMCDAVESMCGGIGIYLQGCAGDVNPVHARQDWQESQRIGRILGAACAQVVLDGLGLLQGLRTISPSWEEEFDAAGRSGAVPIVPDALRATRVLVDVATAHRQPVPIDFDATSARGGAALRSMTWVQRLRAEGNLFGCFDEPSGEMDTLEVQRFHLGTGLDIVALPGEPFQSSARAIRAGREATVLVAGYANQAAGYLPPSGHFAALGYEIGCCQYQPGAAEAVELAARELLRS